MSIRREILCSLPAAWLAACSLLFGIRAEAQSNATGVASDPGLIYGTLYTAKHADSIAVRIGIALIYRDATGEKQRLDKRTDDQGRFSFPGLPVEGGVSYVLRVQGAERPYLSSPLKFEAGQQRLLFNFVIPGPLSTHAQMLPANGPAMASVAGREAAPPASKLATTPASAKTQPMNEWLVLVLSLGVCAAVGFAVRARRPRATNRTREYQ